MSWNWWWRLQAQLPFWCFSNIFRWEGQDIRFVTFFFAFPLCFLFFSTCSSFHFFFLMSHTVQYKASTCMGKVNRISVWSTDSCIDQCADNMQSFCHIPSFLLSPHSSSSLHPTPTPSAHPTVIVTPTVPPMASPTASPTPPSTSPTSPPLSPNGEDDYLFHEEELSSADIVSFLIFFSLFIPRYNILLVIWFALDDYSSEPDPHHGSGGRRKLLGHAAQALPYPPLHSSKSLL